MEKCSIEEIYLGEGDEEIKTFDGLGEYKRWRSVSDRILTTPSVLMDFLKKFYSKESFTEIRGINLLDNSSLRVAIFLPEYTNTVEPLGGDHISVLQHTEVIVKGCYLLGGHLLRQGDIHISSNGIIRKFNYERDMGKISKDALYRKDNREFTLACSTGEEYRFDFFLKSVKVEGANLDICIGYDGGVFNGETTVTIVLNDMTDFYKRCNKIHRKRQEKNMSMV